MTEQHQLWFHEKISKKLEVHYSLDDVFYIGRSQFQTIEIADVSHFGRTLLLDGHVQSASLDESTYHESLVHPAMLAHPTGPKSVFIAGGGEGATAREVLRHRSVERCMMVDIDGDVVEASKKYLPEHHCGAFDDPRFTLVVDDARKALQDSQEKYDVIVLDLADPVEDGPCYKLYTTEFYALCKSRLNEGGLVVTQAGPSSAYCVHEVTAPIERTIRQQFQHVRIYTTHVSSFMDQYAFCIASDAVDPKATEALDEKIDERISAQHEPGRKEDVDAVGGRLLKHYDSETHLAMFSLPKWLRRTLQENQTIITDEHPRFIF